MVTITKGQKPKDNPELVVFSESGDYDENDIIMCGYLGDIDPICGFEAVYIDRGHEAYTNNIIPT